MKPGDLVRFTGKFEVLGIGLILGQHDINLIKSGYYYILTHEGRKLIPGIYFEVIR